MRFEHQGIELWYGTPDAPAPADGQLMRRDDVSVTVAVRPARPENAVRIRYSVDRASVQTLAAILSETDYAEKTQFFKAVFPTFWSGDTVDYLPTVNCNGRRVPDPATATTLPSNFRLDGWQPLPPRTPAPQQPQTTPRFTPRLEHVALVSVPLVPQPEIIGQTPAGFVINWPPVGGTVEGPSLRARVIPVGEHQAVIRSDGMAILTSSVTIETDDHALIGLRHTGTVDYGRDWADRLSSGTWPRVLPVRKEIRMLTAHPKYEWVNRLQCIGVGEVHPADAFYTYDMYAVH